MGEAGVAWPLLLLLLLRRASQLFRTFSISGRGLEAALVVGAANRLREEKEEEE